MAQDPAQKIPPQSMEAEISVLGAMLLDNGVIADVVQAVDKDAFYSTAHKVIFEALVELYDEKKAVLEFRKKGRERPRQASNCCTSMSVKFISTRR